MVLHRPKYWVGSMQTQNILQGKCPAMQTLREPKGQRLVTLHNSQMERNPQSSTLVLLCKDATLDTMQTCITPQLLLLSY